MKNEAAKNIIAMGKLGSSDTDSPYVNSTMNAALSLRYDKGTKANSARMRKEHFAEPH